MSNRKPIRAEKQRRKCAARLAWRNLLPALLLALALARAACGQTAPPAVLDRVVAVVNNQAILASDLDEEMRLTVLDPDRGGMGVLTPPVALEQLIARALIQQQIRQEDEKAALPSQAEVDARLTEIRQQLPACVRQHCASNAGWSEFLARHGLTAERVESYLRYRLEVLGFIEQRFRQGIRIEPEAIEDYYRVTLLPQYARGETVPTLKQVAPRIEEILLQQQVNLLFGDWLKNLRAQGEVEVFAPELDLPELNQKKGGPSR